MPFKVRGSLLRDVVVDFASIKMCLVHDVYRFLCRGFEQSSFKNQKNCAVEVVFGSPRIMTKNSTPRIM